MTIMACHHVLAASDKQIATRLAALAAKPPKGATVAVYVERADTREVVFACNAAEPMIPASNQKILTTAAAFHHMKPEYRYETRLGRRGKIKDGVLIGDLVVTGAGDPTFSSRFYPDGDPATTFRHWARDLRRMGVKRVTGNLVGDDAAFDHECVAPGWPVDQSAEWYCAEVSALVFNDGCVDITWQGGAEGGAAEYSASPCPDYLTVVNQVSTAAGKKEHSRWYKRQGRSNTVECRGTVAPGRQYKDYVSVSGATEYFLAALWDALIAEGVEIAGRPVDVHDVAVVADFRKAVEPMLSRQSPPMSEIVTETNLHSQNLFAEMLFKSVGHHCSGHGTFASGREAVLAFLREAKAPLESVRVVDGSGLSRDNRVTAQALVAALRAADAAPWRDLYRDSFPVGGQSGSLKRRFGGAAKSSSTAARVQAKTGYIRGVRALTGWGAQPGDAKGAAGAEYRFSILLNSGEQNVGGAVEWLDKAAMAIVSP